MINTNIPGAVIYSELIQISKLIDCFQFIKFNKTDFSFCPETPIYSTDQTDQENKNSQRIQDTIDRYVKNVKEQSKLI